MLEPCFHSNAKVTVFCTFTIKEDAYIVFDGPFGLGGR